jgi:hypothetical protein
MIEDDRAVLHTNPAVNWVTSESSLWRNPRLLAENETEEFIPNPLFGSFDSQKTNNQRLVHFRIAAPSRANVHLSQPYCDECHW